MLCIRDNLCSVSIYKEPLYMLFSLSSSLYFYITIFFMNSNAYQFR